MDRGAGDRVGTQVSKAIEIAGVEPAVIAEAVGLDQDEMNARLHGATEFSVSELVEVGGLLRVPARQMLLGGAA